MRLGLWLRLALNLAIHLPRLMPPHLAKTRSYKLLSLGSLLAATIGGSCDLHSIAEHTDPGTLRPENHGACELSHQTTGSHPPPCHLHMPPLSSPKCLVVCTTESLSSPSLNLATLGPTSFPHSSRLWPWPQLILSHNAAASGGFHNSLSKV